MTYLWILSERFRNFFDLNTSFWIHVENNDDVIKFYTSNQTVYGFDKLN